MKTGTDHSSGMTAEDEEDVVLGGNPNPPQKKEQLFVRKSPAASKI